MHQTHKYKDTHIPTQIQKHSFTHTYRQIKRVSNHLYFHNTTTTTLNPMMECLTLPLYFAERLSVKSPLKTFLLCHQQIPYYRPFTLSFDACYGRLSHSKGWHTLGPKKLGKKKNHFLWKYHDENFLLTVSLLLVTVSLGHSCK